MQVAFGNALLRPHTYPFPLLSAAGLGLAGIVCALQGGCEEVVLTDLASVLPYLQKNARFIPGVRVLEFPWGEPPEQYGLGVPYDLILAADCIYDVAQVPLFLHALR